jgi:hypothetical protein
MSSALIEKHQMLLEKNDRQEQNGLDDIKMI